MNSTNRHDHCSVDEDDEDVINLVNKVERGKGTQCIYAHLYMCHCSSSSSNGGANCPSLISIEQLKVKNLPVPTKQVCPFMGHVLRASEVCNEVNSASRAMLIDSAGIEKNSERWKMMMRTNKEGDKFAFDLRVCGCHLQQSDVVPGRKKNSLTLRPYATLKTPAALMYQNENPTTTNVFVNSVGFEQNALAQRIYSDYQSLEIELHSLQSEHHSLQLEHVSLKRKYDDLLGLLANSNARNAQLEMSVRSIDDGMYDLFCKLEQIELEMESYQVGNDADIDGHFDKAVDYKLLRRLILTDRLSDEMNYDLSWVKSVCTRANCMQEYNRLVEMLHRQNPELMVSTFFVVSSFFFQY